LGCSEGRESFVFELVEHFFGRHLVDKLLFLEVLQLRRLERPLLVGFRESGTMALFGEGLVGRNLRSAAHVRSLVRSNSATNTTSHFRVMRRLLIGYRRWVVESLGVGSLANALHYL